MLPEILDPRISGVSVVVARHAMEPPGQVQQTTNATEAAAATKAAPPPDLTLPCFSFRRGRRNRVLVGALGSRPTAPFRSEGASSID